MLKIRFSKIFKKKNFYKIVLIDSRKPREGKFIDVIGFYNNINKKILINVKKVVYWKSKGAVLTKTFRNIFLNEFIKVVRK